MTAIVSEPKCTLNLNGSTFTAGGAWLTEEAGMVYAAPCSTAGHDQIWPRGADWPFRPGCSGKVKTWDGKVIGDYIVTSTWLAPRCARMAALSIVIQPNRHYHGRFGFDSGDAIRIRRVKRELA